jgi:hypothetical protein
LPDPKLGAVAGRLPAGGHEQRVVEERVEVADGEKRRRQVVQLGIERGEVGVAQLLEVAVAGEGPSEPDHVRCREHWVPVAPVAAARRPREVVNPAVEVRGVERTGDSVAIPQPQ